MSKILLTAVVLATMAVGSAAAQAQTCCNGGKCGTCCVKCTTCNSHCSPAKCCKK